MKRFLIKTALALAAAAVLHLAVVLVADGTIDPFYLRFTTPKQSSLVIGTSRTAQGIQPRVLNEALAGSGLALPVFNFSFTLMHSPFGRVYFDAIRDKLDPATRNGLFIVSVDPFGVASISEDPNDEKAFRENGHWLDRLPTVNGSHPNLDYFFNLRQGWGTVLIGKIGYLFRPTKRLHEDGWLEITVPMDPAVVEKRIASKIAGFETNVHRYRVSDVRKRYFEKTACSLEQHGRVFIVRMPAVERVIELENRLMPEFDAWVGEVSKTCRAPFFDFSQKGAEYTYTDGSHLHKTSGAVFTRDLAGEILRALE